ncbi:MAG: GNAT family N-acetyltransferase [Rhodoferax sp.]|uniref:GNAT family N-acetyltransferase n=1 Tax=Rhodoferax sp. TaxID=50421 RepID=UPI0026270F74|nr:GNAT family N-acetyltransferase [Rhodoferax sp.]MDD5335705.1 GNAT family N-acetyltransferase [Rhodoferax sp.]
MKHQTNDYVTQVVSSPLDVNAVDWNGLLSLQAEPTPFMRHAYLAALHSSGSATPETGWTPRFITLTRNGEMVAACALYRKTHSYGEYVFDHAWANAYAQHGLAYYPKAVVAVPFTPVPGTRLMARTAADRSRLVKAVIEWCEAEQLSSLHLLFCDAADIQACQEAGLMLRHTVQFHWNNEAHFTLGRPGGETGTTLYADFEDFLASLSQEKRKKIRQERRKVATAGVTFRWSLGASIAPQDWEFFYRCYERTYLEHGNPPYLNRAFFQTMARTMPENWLLFVAERQGQPMAASLISVHGGRNGPVAYGRYWGALERVDCLHFEACYYQPLAWCIAHGYRRFEGGAQGEHKMARALLPVKTSSAHWLAEPAFAAAVEGFLEREGDGVTRYLDDLGQRTPFRVSPGQELVRK